MAGHQNPDELLRAVEASHEQYLRSLRTLHDALASSVRQRSESRSTIPVSPLLRPASSPALSPQLLGDATFPSQSPGPRSRRPTLDPNERRPQFLSIERKHTPASLHSEYEVEFLPLLDPAAPQRGNGYAPAVPRPIERRSWTDGELMRHLKRTEFHGVAEVAIKDILDKQSDIDENGDFASFAAYEHEGFISSTLELYDIDADGLATPVGRQPNHQTPGLPQVITPSQIVDAPTVWNALKEIHSNGQAVGLMTTLQEPTPLMLEALHLTMSPYFDMTELLRHFTTDAENKGKTRAYVNRAFVKDDTPNKVRQRSAFFVFKYYTVVGEGLEPAAWQKYDKRPSDARSLDHIDIAECSSVLALSLAGPAVQSVKISKRREGPQEGPVFDPFAPWHLLSLQSFPDDEHTVRSEDDLPRRRFPSGPHAFLDALAAEYRDATRRNIAIHERITKLITPPTDFMFDPSLRDKLLFEDKRFTYIRRYFWAYNTLGVINAGLRAMLAAYADSFTDDFWAGRHSAVWPHPDPDGPDAIAWRETMAGLRTELERACRDLEHVAQRNTATRKEIENLRDQLFSGSSIKESRRAIEQGDNIKILTLSSMVFLPLTFVTSVFGITEFTIPPSDFRFALTMVLVCVPFILLLILLQTRTGYSLFKRAADRIRRARDDLVRKLRGPEPVAPSPRAPGRVQTLTGEVKPRRKRRLTVRRGPEDAPDGETDGEGWIRWGSWRWKSGADGKTVEVKEDTAARRGDRLKVTV
ncbi:hypothetical protein D7B24_008142 [Verticillium nonalfalfae]|uniref:Uncharacterized protein n=1 Tax=Verticillium nonalfalfae TaxID=1051616 RepID=A0A3M9YN30_9PEZI|nr:uncharacterized protein D7B24_008142 [Verticillium nonalfalfae]RNJ60450.1 hypothetical protein D7B24_008142 [Verticillium nonalfalfae]